MATTMFARALLEREKRKKNSTGLSSNVVYDIVSGERVHSRTWTLSGFTGCHKSPEVDATC